MQNNGDIFLSIELYDIKMHYKASSIIKIVFLYPHTGQS